MFCITIKGTATHSPQEKRKEPHKTVSVTTAAAHAEDDTSTLKQELSKAWKRIADLETRIHDLTLRSTMVGDCNQRSQLHWNCLLVLHHNV